MRDVAVRASGENIMHLVRPAILCAVLVVLLGALIVLGNNFYWGASPNHPAGEYYLFKRPLPTALGHILWVGIKPLLILTPLATIWAFYRFVRAVRSGPRPGHCPRCGYDLRATPAKGGPLLERCPECGTKVGGARAGGSRQSSEPQLNHEVHEAHEKE